MQGRSSVFSRREYGERQSQFRAVTCIGDPAEEPTLASFLLFHCNSTLSFMICICYPCYKHV